MIIVNMYIPPIGSQYAPKGIPGYIGVLEEMQEWVYSTQMQRGNTVGIFWVGDFNAHVRDLNQQSAAKSDTAYRGARLLHTMGNWGYVLTSWGGATGGGRQRGTYRCHDGTTTTVDYVWSWTAQHTSASPTNIYYDHWETHPCPSPHAILSFSITGAAPTTTTTPRRPPLPPPRQPIRITVPANRI